MKKFELNRETANRLRRQAFALGLVMTFLGIGLLSYLLGWKVATGLVLFGTGLLSVAISWRIEDLYNMHEFAESVQRAGAVQQTINTSIAREMHSLAKNAEQIARNAVAAEQRRGYR